MEQGVIETLVQFGVAGLMGALWVWERAYSRRRERQLTETHNRLMDGEEQTTVLIQLVQRNTRALVEFERTQKRTCEVLDAIRREMAQQERGEAASRGT